MVLERTYGLVMGSQELEQGHGAGDKDIGWEPTYGAEGQEHGAAEWDVG